MRTYCINARLKLGLTQCFPMEKVSRKNIAFSPILVVFNPKIWHFLQHVSVAERSKAPVSYLVSQRSSGSRLGSAKIPFYEPFFLNSPRVLYNISKWWIFSWRWSSLDSGWKWSGKLWRKCQFDYNLHKIQFLMLCHKYH